MEMHVRFLNEPFGLLSGSACQAIVFIENQLHKTVWAPQTIGNLKRFVLFPISIPGFNSMQENFFETATMAGVGTSGPEKKLLFYLIRKVIPWKDYVQLDPIKKINENLVKSVNSSL